ncbi:type IV toxin-antitoxin system AbiEi family antitoxin domain-containing protein [Mycolicibacterium sp. XJ870]
MSDRIALRRRLHQVAFRQRGYFNARQAKDTGYTYQAQKYHVDRGNWTRIDRGVFRLADWPPAEGDSFVRWFVWSDRRGVISHQSAAEAHQLGEVDPANVHITMPPGFSTRNTLVIVHVASLESADIEVLQDFAVTTTTRTLLDLAASPEVTQEQLDSVVVDAFDTDMLDRRALQRRMDDFGNFAALRIERALGSPIEAPL